MVAVGDGVLTGRYTSPDDPPEDSRAGSRDARVMRNFLGAEVLDAVARAKAVAEEAGCSMAQLALAWCLRQRAVSSVIVGATRTEHVDDNVAAADLKVAPDLMDRFDALLEPVAAR